MKKSDEVESIEIELENGKKVKVDKSEVKGATDQDMIDVMNLLKLMNE